MPVIRIESVPGFDEWRKAARACLQMGIPPHDVIWQDANDTPMLSLFSQLDVSGDVVEASEQFSVPEEFLDKAETAICFKSSERFSLLYRILWRLVHENLDLLHYQTDDDILKLQHIVKAVRRDAYKITAFVRFRDVTLEGEPHYVCWYEPEHYTLERTLYFFQNRFTNMRWTIMTPYRAASWDGERMLLSDNPDPAMRPGDDAVEKIWLTYYKTIFNPARLKVSAMLNQMPKKYWKNLPESVLIEQMIKDSSHRVQVMIRDAETLARPSQIELQVDSEAEEDPEEFNSELFEAY